MAVIDLSPFNAVLERLERAADRIEQGIGTPAGGAARPAAAAAPAAVAAAPAVEEPAICASFDELTTAKFGPVEAAAKYCGVQDVTESTGMFMAAVRCLRCVLVASGRCKKPKDTDWAGILKPVMELGGKAQKACDNRSEYFQNRKSVAEALNICSMVCVPSPPSHVQNVLESMDFHAIKVMQKKNEKETAWIKALKQGIQALKDWTAENIKLGINWNVQGEDPVAYFAATPISGDAAKAAAAPAKGGGKGKAPPPPKGGLAGPTPEQREKMRAGMSGYPSAAAPAANGGGGGMSEIFNAISEFSTNKLKKVTDDMKTKNQPKVEAKVPAAKAPATKAAAAPAKKGLGPRGPPIKELQKDTNWMIENYEGVSDLVLEGATMQQLVCVINCKTVTLQIKGKIKNLCIDSCERVNIICEDVLSAVELVNCERCKVQTSGKVNSFAIDKCNGVGIYVGKESMAAEFVTSKSSEMNVTMPDQNGEEGDIIEMPIPEQFVTKIAGYKKLKTEVSSIYSG